MTDEQLDSIGETIEQDRREWHDIELAMQAEREAAERARHAQYRCSTEGCSGDPTRPWSCCDNCLYMARLEAKLEQLEQQLATLEGDDGLTVRTPKGDRYFAKEMDAAFTRKIESRKLRDQMARVKRLMSRSAWRQAAEQDFLETRFSITPDGERALREAELIDEANADVERAGRTVGRLFDAITSMLPGGVAGR